MLQPRLKSLPVPQQTLWPELAEVPKHFVLYGGTGLALRLGHRDSVDFDFFSSEPVSPEALLQSLNLLEKAKIIQNVSHTLTVLLDRNGPVKLSFFGDVDLARVGTPDITADGVILVASLLDLAGKRLPLLLKGLSTKTTSTSWLCLTMASRCAPPWLRPGPFTGTNTTPC